MKIRSPKLVQEELLKIADCPNKMMASMLLPTMIQFWRWIILDSEVRISDAVNLSVMSEEWIERGYPEDDVTEFIFKKLKGMEKIDGESRS